MKKSLFTVFSLFLCFSVLAEEKPTSKATDPATQAQKPEDKKEDGKFTFTGYLDTYYFGNTNRPGSRSNGGVSGFARAFDQRAGQFGIGLVQGKATYSSSKVDGVFDMAFGPFADLATYGNVASLNVAAGTSTSLAIKQAYLAYKASPKWTITAGQFGTHIGYEVIDAPLNYNYSLSNLFNNGPFYHIGVKAQYAISDKAYLMVGAVNNVDNIADNNRAKGLIGQLYFTPASGFNVYVNGIYSNEANVKANGKDSTGAFSILDLVATYQITPKFFVGLNAAVGSQTGDYQGTGSISKAGWSGVALYSHYDVTDKCSFGVRYENFNNADGARFLRAADGSGTKVNSFTLTSSITAADGHLVFKPEVRIDAFDKNQFEDADGNGKKGQTTLGMAAIFKF